MHLRIIDDTEKFAELRAEWTEFLETSAWKHVFLTHEFLFPWWKHVAADATLSITAVCENSRILALAPLMLTRTRLARCPIRKLELIGARWGYGGILFDPDRPGALDALLAELATLGDWHILELPKLLHPPDDFAKRLTEAFPTGRFLHETVNVSIPYISLQTSWERYLNDRSRSFRRNLRNRTRRLEQLGTPRYVHVASCSKPCLEPQRILEHLAVVASRSWKAKAGTAINSTPERFAYYSELIERMYDAGLLEVGILFVDERPVSYVVGTLYNGEFMEIDIAYDEALSSCSPGILARLHLLESYLGRDLRCYDFVEFEHHKLELTSQFHETLTHIVFRRAAYPMLLRWLNARVRPWLVRSGTDAGGRTRSVWNPRPTTAGGTSKEARRTR